VSQNVEITGETIRLGQLLKLVGVIDSGSEAKALLAEQTVLVNDEPEARRGRQLHPGDRVRLAGHDLSVTTAPSPQ
jgi:ribosome-associated protein